MIPRTEVLHDSHGFLQEEARLVTAPVNVSSRRTEAGKETEAGTISE